MAMPSTMCASFVHWVRSVCIGRGARSAARAVGCTLLVLSTGLLWAGCSGNRDLPQAWLLTEGKAAELTTLLLEDPNPDVRRRAIDRLAQSRYVSDPVVHRAMALAANTDEDQAVRCAAVRALGRTCDESARSLMLGILSPRQRQGGDVPPDASVRMAALDSLIGCARRGAVEARIPDWGDAAAATAVLLLRNDSSRHVRIKAARLLAFYPKRDVLYRLADALEQRDFGVCFEARRSLIELTGRGFGHDASAWRDFLDSCDDPFAGRETPDGHGRRPESPWLERSWDSVVAAFSGSKREPSRDRKGADARGRLIPLPTASLRARLGSPIDSDVMEH